MIKIILTTVVFFFFSFIALCQNIQNTGAIRQKICIKQYAGKTIVLKAASKVKPLENMAGSVLFFKTQKQNGKEGQTVFCKKKQYIPGWQIDSIGGILENDADSLSFGFIFTGKAVCKFDDFNLQIDNKLIPIGDNSFETNKDFPNQYWTAPILPIAVKISIAKVNSFAGDKSLVIDASDGALYSNVGDSGDVGKFANVNGIKIYYETYGTGEPLLLLHGNRQSIQYFQQQIIKLSKYYKVIAVDTRGHGQSTTDNKTYSYDLFAEDMNLLLEVLKIKSTNIVGWSDGGNTGLIMAIKYPDKVKKLVTMGANIFINNTVIGKATFKEVYKEIATYKSDSSIESKNTIRILTMLLNEPKHTFEELKTITCPVLVVAGEKDLIKEAHTKGIAASIKNSVLKIVKKETHEFPQENPLLFNQMVLDFLKK